MSSIANDAVLLSQEVPEHSEMSVKLITISLGRP